MAQTNKKQLQFFDVQNAIDDLYYENCRVIANERYLLNKLHRLSVGKGYAFAGNEHLSAFMGLSVSQIGKLLLSLEEKNLIKRVTTNTRYNKKVRQIYVCEETIMKLSKKSDSSEKAPESYVENVEDRPTIKVPTGKDVALPSLIREETSNMPDSVEEDAMTGTTEHCGDEENVKGQDNDAQLKVGDLLSFIKELGEEYHYPNSYHIKNTILKICRDNEIDVTTFVTCFKENQQLFSEKVASMSITGNAAMQYIFKMVVNMIKTPENKTMEVQPASNNTDYSEFARWITVNYYVKHIPPAFFKKIDSIANGTYKDLTKPIQEDRLFECWQHYFDQLKQKHPALRQKNPTMNDIEFVYYDLATVVNMYGKYLDYRYSVEINQITAEEQEAESKRRKEEQKFLSAFNKKASKPKKGVSIDKILDEWDEMLDAEPAANNNIPMEAIETPFFEENAS